MYTDTITLFTCRRNDLHFLLSDLQLWSSLSLDFPWLLSISLQRIMIGKDNQWACFISAKEVAIFSCISSMTVFTLLWCRKVFIWKQTVWMSNKTTLCNQSVCVSVMNLLRDYSSWHTFWINHDNFESKSSWSNVKERPRYRQSKPQN